MPQGPSSSWPEHKSRARQSPLKRGKNGTETWVLGRINVQGRDELNITYAVTQVIQGESQAAVNDVMKGNLMGDPGKPDPMGTNLPNPG